MWNVWENTYFLLKIIYQGIQQQHSKEWMKRLQKLVCYCTGNSKADRKPTYNWGNFDLTLCSKNGGKYAGKWIWEKNCSSFTIKQFCSKENMWHGYWHQGSSSEDQVSPTYFLLSLINQLRWHPVPSCWCCKMSSWRLF